MSTTTNVTSQIATGVATALTNNSNASSATVSTLQGLAANLAGASTDTGRKLAAEEIIRTPNSGVAAQIAEKLINDLGITDPTQKSIAILTDMQALNAAVTMMAHTSGFLSNLVASLGL